MAHEGVAALVELREDALHTGRIIYQQQHTYNKLQRPHCKTDVRRCQFHSTNRTAGSTRQYAS